MNKILILLTACCALFSCFDTTDKQKVKTDTDWDAESYNDFEDLLLVGEGSIYQHPDNKSKWYFEPITIGFEKNGIIHSSFDCPTVKNGVIQNACSSEKLNHSFCTKCMNNELIEKWSEWFEEKKKERSVERARDCKKDGEK